MKWLKEWGRFSLLLFLFSSCSTKPEYHIHKIYTNSSPECVEKCEVNRKNCELSCKREYQNCIRETRSEAERVFNREIKIYRENLRVYENLYKQYLKAYDRWFFKYEALYSEYEYYKKKCGREPENKYACKKAKQLKSELDRLTFIRPSPPSKPQPPKFNSIFNDLKTSCVNDCGCEKEFDRCFTMCGGKIEIKKTCIKNCKNN